MTDEEKVEVEKWLRIRKEAALQIDPATAEMDCIYANLLDPYGVNPDVPEDDQWIDRVYFVRSPGSDVWVCVDDLPKETEKALRGQSCRKQTDWAEFEPSSAESRADDLPF
jgi:hypothetical protein